jgi:hypothetical protein
VFRELKARTSASFDKTKQEAGDGQNSENYEQNFPDSDSAGSNATEAEQRGNQRNDKKYNGIVQHDNSPG